MIKILKIIRVIMEKRTRLLFILTNYKVSLITNKKRIGNRRFEFRCLFFFFSFLFVKNFVFIIWIILHILFCFIPNSNIHFKSSTILFIHFLFYNISTSRLHLWRIIFIIFFYHIYFLFTKLFEINCGF